MSLSFEIESISEKEIEEVNQSIWEIDYRSYDWLWIKGEEIQRMAEEEIIECHCWVEEEVLSQWKIAITLWVSNKPNYIFW